MVERGKKYAVLTKQNTIFIWDYKQQENVRLDPDKIPAISSLNDPDIIDNPESVMFPENPNDIKFAVEKEEEDLQERISLRSRNEQINERRASKNDDDDEDDEQSILIQKLREHVIRFERLLGKYLDPDLPTSRKLKKKYLEERNLFKKEGYIEFIDAIKLKVEAICTFENDYTMEQFDGISKDDDEIRDGFFKKKIEDAKKGDFHSAQEVVNSVMQIVIEEEYGVPRRRLVTKIK